LELPRQKKKIIPQFLFVCLQFIGRKNGQRGNAGWLESDMPDYLAEGFQGNAKN